jgi:hypothetical protein
VKFTIVKGKVYPVKQFLQFTFNWGPFHRGSSRRWYWGELERRGRETKNIKELYLSQSAQSAQRKTMLFFPALPEIKKLKLCDLCDLERMK